jgi:peptide/nickel transport system substrate-binding protein
VRRFRAMGMIALSVGIAAVLLSACSSSPGTSSAGGGGGTSVPTGGTKISGGTASWAELPGSAPNLIFPFDPSGFFSVPNISEFQYLMYRPLYWFGQGSTPNLNLSLSVGKEPNYSADGKSVTIGLNNYKW